MSMNKFTLVSDPVALTNTGVTAYSAHASGSTPVTSNAATDLDTTAAALATLVSEVTTLRADVAALHSALSASN